MSDNNNNIQETIVELLNQASIYGKDNQRVQHLRHVQELILRKHPDLLEHFLPEVLTFQTDKSIEIKKTIISFLEEACQINPKIIFRLVDNIHFLLYDDNLFVQKKLITSLCSIYKSTFLWLKQSKIVEDNFDYLWEMLTKIKLYIVSQLNSNNEGLCIPIIKFIETLIIIFSEQYYTVLSPEIFKQQSQHLIDKLIEFTLCKHISNNNLIAIIESLMSIIRYQPDFMNRILQTLEVLQRQLPEHLTESQIENIKKILKCKLVNFVKHSNNTNSNMIELLNQLGATPTEIQKYLPKRKPSFSDSKLNIKRAKNFHDNRNSTDLVKNRVRDQSIDNLIRKLTLENVVDLVLHSMHSLPDEIPLSFQKSFTPITNAGSPSQIEYLARLLSTQIESVSVPSNKVKSSKLVNTIKPFSENEIQQMSISSFHRILDCFRQIPNIYIYKIVLSSLACLFRQSFSNIYRDFIFADINDRYDLALIWIYREYVHASGYLIESQTNQLTRYDQLLCEFLEYLQENSINFFCQLIKDIPLVTDNALLLLQRVCQDEDLCEIGLDLLKYFISYRIPIRDKCLNILFNLTQNENQLIRTPTVDITIGLYKRDKCRQSINKYVERLLDDFSLSARGSTIISCYFSLYFPLLQLNHCLIQPLIMFYSKTNENVQKTICQQMQILIKETGLQTSALLQSITSCPNGAETMIIHLISTDAEHRKIDKDFITNVKRLYYTHKSDIRFLLPIISHLNSNDITNVLPELIQLHPNVVKEYFNKLFKSNISPSELFIELHQISIEECDLKHLIYATSLCFNERLIYTDHILADIIDKLVELTPTPILFMRTVLQTLCVYPKMINFIMTILQRLIAKQPWKQSRIWEGFIKCCEKTRPYSFSLLLQLPPVQLKQILDTTSDLHDSLRNYICSMSTVQRSLISSSILQVIENN